MTPYIKTEPSTQPLALPSKPHVSQPTNIKTEPFPTNIKTEPFPTNVKTKPFPTNVKTKPFPTNVKTEPFPTNVKTEPLAPKLEPDNLVITLDNDNDDEEEDELIDDHIMEHAKEFVGIKTSDKFKEAMDTMDKYREALNKLRDSLMTKGVKKATFKHQDKSFTVSFRYRQRWQKLCKPKVIEE